MKVYITRRGKPDFVTDADTVADAIIGYWIAAGETPKASYRVHFGRRRKSRVISSAVCYWRLDLETQSLLYDVLKETATKSQFTKFCDITVAAGLLLGK